MTRDVRPYVSARKTVAPTLAPDGTIAVLADTTGTTQVWTVEGRAAWPTQRTFYDERVSFVDWSPAGDAVTFGKDAGADEHDQLFVLDPDTGAIEQVTDRPDAIHSWGGWHPDGDRFAFAANRRETARFDVYTMRSDDGEPTFVAEGDGRLSIEGWHPDGDEVVVRTPTASSEDGLALLDVEDGTWRSLTTESKERASESRSGYRYRQPTVGPDDALYCLSDILNDTLELVRLDLDGGRSASAESGSVRVPEPTTVVSGGDWSLDGFALDADTGRIAYTRNVDGYSELYAGRIVGAESDGDEANGAVSVETERIECPAGVVHGLTIGPGGRHLAVTLSTPTLNHSVYRLDLADEGGALERWTTPSHGGVPLDAYDEPEVVRYETFDTGGTKPATPNPTLDEPREIPAYVTLPEEASAASPVPVIVDVHGGPHHQRRPWFRPVRQYFLDAGYAVFEPNVRGSSGYGRTYAAADDVEKRMDSVRDLAAAVDWLAEQPSIDPEGIVAYGRSYGGFMVLAAITEYPDLWAAAVDFVGIANWVTFLEETGDWRRSHREAEYGSLEDDREFLESISPIHAAGEIRCPLFVQHGENDPRVPVGEARQIVEEVESRGVPVESLIFEDEGHHITKLDNRLETFERIAAFLDEHVRRG